MELDEHLLTDGQFGIEGFLVPTCVVEPDQGAWKVQESEPFFAADLDGCWRTKGYGFRPDRGDIRTATDLSEDRIWVGFRIAKTEADDLIIRILRARPAQMPNALNPVGFFADDVLAPIDQFEQFSA